MKTTLHLDDELVRLAKQRAALDGTTLRGFVEDAIQARLLPRAEGMPAFRLELPVVQGDAPPTVNIADRDALYDLMERE